MDFAFGRAGDRHRTHSADTRQGVGDSLIEYFVESRHAFCGVHRKQDDGNHVGGELEDNRRFGIVGHRRRHHVQFVADIVGEHVDILAVLELKSYHRYVLATLGSYMFKVAHRVENILQRAGDILLYVLRAGAGIGCHHHQSVCLDVGIKVYWEFVEREQTENHHCHEAEDGHNRPFHGTTVEAHMLWDVM